MHFKPTLWIFLLMFFSLESKAQLSADFPDSNYYWNANHSFSLWEMGAIDEFYHTIYYKRDSIINDTLYHVIYIKYSILNNNGYWGPRGVNYHNDKYYGLLRNDKKNKKVYIKREAYLHNFPRTKIDSSEKLLFDFSLKVGDVYPVTIHNESIDSNMYVFKIDTILDPYNIKRACYFVHSKWGGPSDTGFFNGIVIQGVGGRSGLIGDIFTYMDWSYSEYFNCFSFYNKPYTPYVDALHVSLYSNNECKKHQYLSVENTKPTDILVYPNPVNAVISLVLSEKDLEFNITNSIGESTFIEGVKNGEVWLINVENINPGIYLISAKGKNNFYSARFLKL